MKISVLIADDQPLVRAGLRMILEAEDDITVIAEASDGRSAVELARARKPDVCLLDIRMPIVNGIDATRALAGPDVREPMAVVVITTFDLDEYVYGALEAGARGFLLKDAGPALLAQAVRAAASGEALIAPSVTVRLLRTFAAMHTSAAREPSEPLTDREREVLDAIATGATNQEIAHALHISLSTVKTHIANLLAKLGARNRVELALWAHKRARSRGAHPFG